MTTARYTVHMIRDANCTEIDAAVLGQSADSAEAEKLAREIANSHYYGVATVDNEARTVNFGDVVKPSADVVVVES